MIKVLVLEDNTKLFQTYLARHIKDRLTDLAVPVELVHVTNFKDALQLLLGDEIQFGLIDFDAGKPFKAQLADGPLLIRKGDALIATVRAVRLRDDHYPIPTIGMASHPAGNRLMLAAGANAAVEKHNAPELVEKVVRGI